MQKSTNSSQNRQEKAGTNWQRKTRILPQSDGRLTTSRWRHSGTGTRTRQKPGTLIHNTGSEKSTQAWTTSFELGHIWDKISTELNKIHDQDLDVSKSTYIHIKNTQVLSPEICSSSKREWASHSPQQSYWLHSALLILPLPTAPCIKMQPWCLPLWEAFIIKVPSPANTLQPVNNMTDVLSSAA